MRRSLGALGRLRYVAQQPGVEFHLELERPSNVLGQPGRWWGWQCRWYDIAPGRRLGSTRQERIESAIRKAERHVPNMTDWVLWTRKPLTRTDQAWFFAIPSEMRLHLWTEADLDAHLVGEAEILRRSYFGDLVLTPEGLSNLREQCIAPVRDRWLPKVHTEVDAESELRRLLAEPDHWNEVTGLAGEVDSSARALAELLPEVDEDLRGQVQSLANDLRELSGAARATSLALQNANLTAATERTAAEPSFSLSRAQGTRLARSLRERRSHCSFAVQAALARRRDAKIVLTRLRAYVSTSAIAVVGPAGCGKTHLAAELTVSRGHRPCGIYLQAWPLTKRGTTTELITRVGDVGAETFVELLEAVDAAASRAGTRLPVVIDGLNESEDPVSWKSELASLVPVLDRLPNVLLVVTVRPSVANIAVPEGLGSLELPGFDHATPAAVDKYFQEYKIDPGSVPLPYERFQEPLFLRIFCEATNPGREATVRLDEVPASLIATFIRFRATVAKRIADRPGGMRRYVPDILKALDAIALSLWSTKRRAMPFDEIRELIGDNAQDWTKSLARDLLDEGLLSAEPRDGGYGRVVVLFDAFAGFLVADTLIRERGPEDFTHWIADDDTRALLGSNSDGAHPLASDIRGAFVGLVPRRFRTQFWQLVDGELRREATLAAADLEATLLDEATVSEIGRLALQPHAHTGPSRFGRDDLFDRFRELRDTAGHPLNAEFLDHLLGTPSVVDRDLRWSEWVRRRESDILADIHVFTELWLSKEDRTHEDGLRALWLKWLLTSTHRDLRDLATRALYWYGRGEPKALFRLVRSSLGANDPYVTERLLAASFGVMMAAPGEQREFGRELSVFLTQLWNAFSAENAAHRTDHWMIRHSVEGIVGVARRYYPSALGEWSTEWAFKQPARPESIGCDDPRNSDRELVYGGDFRNYTVGRLVPNRANYHFEDPEYEEVSSWIRGRVWELGWRPEFFKATEDSIAEYRRYRVHRRGRIESYQKKYCWIGFFEAAGRLLEEGRSPLMDGETHLSDVDIDPSFPSVPRAAPACIPGLLSDDFSNLENWVLSGTVDIPDHMLRPQTLEGIEGPWVALSATLRQRDLETKREVFAVLWSMLVNREDEQKLRCALRSRHRPGDLWQLHPLESYYVFAGEMPWSSCARFEEGADNLPQLYARTAKGEDGQEIPVELTANYYAWESYHSVTNEAGGFPVPAVTLADALDLRVVPASLDWCDAQGRRASMTFGPPGRFEKSGHLLYLREDLIRDYCNRRDYELLWMVWGERSPWFADRPRDLPAWLLQAHQDYTYCWRRIASLEDLATD